MALVHSFYVSLNKKQKDLQEKIKIKGNLQYLQRKEGTKFP